MSGDSDDAVSADELLRAATATMLRHRAKNRSGSSEGSSTLSGLPSLDEDPVDCKNESIGMCMLPCIATILAGFLAFLLWMALPSISNLTVEAVEVNLPSSTEQKLELFLMGNSTESELDEELKGIEYSMRFTMLAMMDMYTAPSMAAEAGTQAVSSALQSLVGIDEFRGVNVKAAPRPRLRESDWTDFAVVVVEWSVESEEIASSVMEGLYEALEDGQVPPVRYATPEARIVPRELAHTQLFEDESEKDVDLEHVGRFQTAFSFQGDGLEPPLRFDSYYSSSEEEGEEEEEDGERTSPGSRSPQSFPGRGLDQRSLASTNGVLPTKTLHAARLWERGFMGEGIVVAVFDTGLVAPHPHFRNVLEPRDWTDEGTPKDNHGHGSHVAGLIASSAFDECPGFAPDATIWPFRVFTTREVSFTSWFLDAFNHALAAGVDVLNLSIGGPDFMDRPFVEKMWELTASGIVVVSAIGNDGPRYGTLNNPADQPDVIGVGAVGAQGQIPHFSSRGMTTWELPGGYGRLKPDLLAPGSNIMGSYITGGCRGLSGTSVASPVIAGSVALLASSVPKEDRVWAVNPASMKQILLEGATRVNPALGAGAFEQGAGVIDLEASYNLLATYEPKATFSPAEWDMTDCPYAWPYCASPIYPGAAPLIFNATLLNGMSVWSVIEGEPEWIPGPGGEVLDVKFHVPTKTVWPWSGTVGVLVSVGDIWADGASAWGDAVAAGKVSGEVVVKVKAPPARFGPGSDIKGPRYSEARLKLTIIVRNAPERSRRVLFDAYHSLRYPPAYLPRDNLDGPSNSLDWNGDHPHTNFKGMFSALRTAGYFLEVARLPLSCYDLSQYGTVLIVDPEDAWFPEEVTAVDKAVREQGLGLLVWADWWNEEVMAKVRFYDENTLRWWNALTGGANVPALNEFLAPFGLAFSDSVWSGTVRSGRDTNFQFLSGNAVAEVPAGATVYSSALKNQGLELTTKARAESTVGFAASFDVGKTESLSGGGRVAVFGDSGCLDDEQAGSKFCYTVLEHAIAWVNGKDPGTAINGLEGTYHSLGWTSADERRARGSPTREFISYSRVLGSEHPDCDAGDWRLDGEWSSKSDWVRSTGASGTGGDDSVDISWSGASGGVIGSGKEPVATGPLRYIALLTLASFCAVFVYLRKHRGVTGLVMGGRSRTRRQAV